MVFGRGDIVVDFRFALAFEVFVNELAVVHLEVVVDELQCGVVVANHEVGVFAHDVDLTYSLFVEFVEHAVMLFGVAGFPFGFQFQLQGV